MPAKLLAEVTSEGRAASTPTLLLGLGRGISEASCEVCHVTHTQPQLCRTTFTFGDENNKQSLLGIGKSFP